MPKIAKDRTGEHVGRLVVLRRARRKALSWLCRCDCGNLKIVRSYNLKIGHTESCGCYWLETISKGANAIGARTATHGLSRTREYRSWERARHRCYNPIDVRYEDYHGRGIVMCRRWRKDFEKFLKDMGKCPEGLQLDRKDNDGNYSCGKCKECRRNGWPLNCRWATRSQQMRNRRPFSAAAKRNMSIAAIRRYQVVL